MAVVMALRWDGKNAEDYEAVMRELDLEGQPADGGIVHVACITGAGLRVLDVWESEEKWDRFLSERLGPAIARAGLEGEPQVDLAPLHNLYTPDPEAVARMGASPQPA
jgi:hypothetical protein